MMVDHGNRHQHVAGNAKRRYAAEKSNNQSQPSEKLRTNGQERQGSRDSHAVSEEAHGPAESVTTIPAKHFLRAVSKEHDSHDKSRDGQRKIVRIGSHDSSKHVVPL